MLCHGMVWYGMLRQVDFVDINMGCPIDAVCNKGMGAGLCLKPQRVQGICRAMAELLTKSELTIKNPSLPINYLTNC